MVTCTVRQFCLYCCSASKYSGFDRLKSIFSRLPLQISWFKPIVPSFYFFISAYSQHSLKIVIFFFSIEICVNRIFFITCFLTLLLLECFPIFIPHHTIVAGYYVIQSACPYHFHSITCVFIHGFSLNFAYTFIPGMSGLRLLMGEIHQFLTELSPFWCQ